MTTGIKNWSTTAASNNASPPNGFPEGMAPASVNDSARQVMAEVRAWYEDPAWIDFGNTPTQTGASTFTVATDLTARYAAGRRLRMKGTTPFTLYGTIASSSYSAPNTTVTMTMDSGSLDSSLSEIALNIASVGTTELVATGGNNTFTGTNTFTGKVIYPDDGELTIASGAVTVTGVYHTIDTEGDAGSDDLDTINGGADGQILSIRTENSSRDVSITNAGNIVTPDGSTFVLSSTSEACLLQYDGTLTKWIVLSKNTAATATARGEVELATDAELQTGTDTARAVTPANIKNSIGFTDYVETAQQTITAGGALTIAHGLGRQPIFYPAFLQCTTNDNGYTVGQEIPIGFVDSSGSASGYGVSIIPDATNLVVRYGNAATSSFIYLSAGGGAVVTLLNSSWRLVIRAWA